jgi:hypothetical protein
MEMRREVEQACESPEALERMYREALDQGNERDFARALAQCSEIAPDSVLLRAWRCRLDLTAEPADSHAVGGAGGHDVRPAARQRRRHWSIALLVSVVCGALFALFAGNQPPVPVPGVARSLFWIGWAPLAAAAIVLFHALVSQQAERRRWQVGAVAGAAATGLLAAATVGGRADDAAALVALHLPFVAWALIGLSVVLGRPDRAAQAYAYVVRSMETLVAGGIFLLSGGVFGGLTLGIFAVFGIQPPEALLRAAAAFGIGVIPVLSVASVYDPTVAPTRQRPTGLARILRIMTWLMLPAALGVLTLYLVWFVPAYFWRPFAERSVLIVYNATIIAILALLALAVSPAVEGRELKATRILRPAVLALSGLTLLLNLYALTANLSRTIELGLTVNRHTVLGWNLVTVAMLGFLLAASLRVDPDDWLLRFRSCLGWAMLPAVGWAAWVVLGLPLF